MSIASAYASFTFGHNMPITPFCPAIALALRRAGRRFRRLYVSLEYTRHVPFDDGLSFSDCRHASQELIRGCRADF